MCVFSKSCQWNVNWISSNFQVLCVISSWKIFYQEQFSIISCCILINFSPHLSSHAEILGALLSIFTIWLVTAVLVYLAVERIVHDDYTIEGTIMLITSGCAVLANIMWVKCTLRISSLNINDLWLKWILEEVCLVCCISELISFILWKYCVPPLQSMALTLHQSGHGHSHGGLSSHGHGHGHSHKKGKEKKCISNHSHGNDHHADAEQNHGMFLIYKSLFCHFLCKYELIWQWNNEILIVQTPKHSICSMTALQGAL